MSDTETDEWVAKINALSADMKRKEEERRIEQEKRSALAQEYINTLERQRREMFEFIVWNCQTLHQTYHDQWDGGWRECTKPLCDEARNTLRKVMTERERRTTGIDDDEVGE